MRKREAIYPVVLAILWGLNWPAIRIALHELPVFVLRLIGFTSAGLLLLAIALVLRRRLGVRASSWFPLVMAGTLNIAGFNTFTAFAQLNTTTSRAAILTFTMPIWSALLAALVLGEAIDRWKLIALAAGAAGIAMLALPVFQSGEVLGIVFPLLAALSWALGTVLQKKYPPAGDPIATTAYQLLIGAVIALICMLATGQTPPSSVSPQVIGAMAFHIIGASALAYVLWFAILARNAASTTALLSFAVPVVGVLSAMLIVGDRPTPVDWLGFAAILFAAALALRSGLNRPKV